MSETQRERELKFDLPERWELPDVTRFVPDGGSVQHETQRLESTYFDTAGRDLFASLVTLRRRSGDADNGWHLKIPMDGARQEVRLPLGTGRGVPAELRDLTAGLRGRATLRTIATLRTEREVRRIVSADGVGLAEIVHDTVTATVKHEFSVIRSWQEAEVELLGDVDGSGGDERLLARIAKWLGKHDAAPSASLSKLGRALEASARPPRPATTAAGVIGAYLDTNFAAIVAGDVTLRRDHRAAGDPASALPADELHRVIHATRVASRRYRSTVRIFARALDGERASTLDGELAWFAAALGEVRDRHVLRTHLDTAFDELAPELIVGPVRRRVERTLDAEEAAARAALAEVMMSARYAALLAELRDWTADLPVRDTDEPASTVERYVRKASAVMDERIVAARDASTDDAAYHRARKAAKRARYAGELAVPAMGGTARHLAKRAKKRQERLGDRQDEVVAAEFLLRLGAVGGNGFTLGVLYQRQRDLAERSG